MFAPFFSELFLIIIKIIKKTKRDPKLFVLFSTSVRSNNVGMHIIRRGFASLYGSGNSHNLLKTQLDHTTHII